MREKACTKCGKVEALEDFSPDRRNSDGRTSHCRTCMNAANRSWAARNHEYESARCRRKQARRRTQHPEKVSQDKRRRLERLANAPGGEFDPGRDDYRDRVEFWAGCSYCGGAYEVLDHDVPLSRGGTNFAENIRPACWSCNLRKHTKTAAEFLVWLKNKALDGRRGYAAGRTTGPRLRRRG